jgi:hypothetical protein
MALEDDLADHIRKSGSGDGEPGDSGMYAGIFAFALLFFIIGFVVGMPSVHDTNYKSLYEKSVCESKGLQVGKLEDITVCLNPETKAVYKIELPTVKKDK